MYIRDKRSPTPKNETVSRVMSANRARNTTPELTLRKALWAYGLRGYRLHYKIKLHSAGGRPMQKPARSKGISSLPIQNPQSKIQNPNGSPPYEGGVAAFRGRGGSLFVRPDITFVSKKIAIFVMGCFCHDVTSSYAHNGRFQH